MVKNRFFKTTMGRFAEIAIATQVDASDGTPAFAQPSIATLPLTVNASPTAGHILTLPWGGLPSGVVLSTVSYTVPATPSTAIVNAGVVAAIQAALASIPGASVTSTGTTSQVITISIPGASFNAVTLTPATTGNSWTVGSAIAFAGGVNADAVAADNLEDFVNNALAGSIWAFWADTKLALVAGDTALVANKNRSFFYAWKGGTATEYHRSTAIPVATRLYDSIAYNAGTAQVSTLTVGGTVSVGQKLHVRIVNTTSGDLPYPGFEYQTPIVTNADAALVIIAAAINAEALGNDPIVTATSSTNTLPLTAKNKYTSFEVISFIEVTTAYPTDASAITKATSVKQKAPIGDTASIVELQRYFIENNGGTNYTPEGTSPDEFGTATIALGSTQFGYLLVKSIKEEAGVVRAHTNHKANIVIAIKNADLAALAAL